MNTSVKMIVVLTVITIFSGMVLSTWDGFTSPKIAHHKLQELKAAIGEVLPSFDKYQEVTRDGITFYVGKDTVKNSTVGIAMEAVGNGFQGEISMMVGVTHDFEEITGLKVLNQLETPGLGTKIVEDPSNKEDKFWFPNQFKGLHTQPEIGVVKNKKPEKNTDIQAITGATISSKAVANILNKTIDNAQKKYQK